MDWLRTAELIAAELEKSLPVRLAVEESRTSMLTAARAAHTPDTAAITATEAAQLAAQKGMNYLSFETGQLPEGSVVIPSFSITSSTGRSVPHPWLRVTAADSDEAKVYLHAGDATVRFLRRDGILGGAGVLLDDETVGTAAHVLRTPRPWLSVKGIGEVRGQIVGIDRKADVGLVRIDRLINGPTPIELKPHGSITPGTKLYAIGHPARSESRVLSEGRILSFIPVKNFPWKTTEVGSESNNTAVVMHTAETYKGNSGGGLYLFDGEPRLIALQSFGSAGRANSGAVSINHLIPLYKQVKAGAPSSGWLSQRSNASFLVEMDRRTKLPRQRFDHVIPISTDLQTQL